VRGTGITRDDEAKRLMMRKLDYRCLGETRSGEKEEGKAERSKHCMSLTTVR
jgi:hypothetical protein